MTGAVAAASRTSKYCGSDVGSSTATPVVTMMTGTGAAANGNGAKPAGRVLAAVVEVIGVIF
jgi:hypothetical protein